MVLSLALLVPLLGTWGYDPPPAAWTDVYVALAT